MGFDPQALFDRLQRLDARLAAAFATAIAERFLPSMIRFASANEKFDASGVVETLDRIWQCSAGVPLNASEASQRLDACVRIIERLSQARGPLAKYGEDAVSALAYALRSYTIGPKEAGWAAQRGYDAVDYFVSEECGVDYTTEGEAAVLNHRVVQRELQRQQEDLEYVEQLAEQGENATASIAQLRERARRQSQSVFAVDA